MPEPPDFDQIARRLVERGRQRLMYTAVPGTELKALGPVESVSGGLVNAPINTPEEAIVEALRLIWNARGAADIAKLDDELSSMMGLTSAGPYVKNLDRALRSLDR